MDFVSHERCAQIDHLAILPHHGVQLKAVFGALL
jgi:hypothetical protein